MNITVTADSVEALLGNVFQSETCLQFGCSPEVARLTLIIYKRLTAVVLKPSITASATVSFFIISAVSLLRLLAAAAAGNDAENLYIDVYFESIEGGVKRMTDETDRGRQEVMR